MAIAVVYKVPAMSADQYRQSWIGGPPVAPPAGLIFHTGIGEDTSFFTVTVWESRAAYDAFAFRIRGAGDSSRSPLPSASRHVKWTRSRGFAPFNRALSPSLSPIADPG